MKKIFILCTVFLFFVSCFIAKKDTIFLMYGSWINQSHKSIFFPENEKGIFEIQNFLINSGKEQKELKESK